MGVEFELPEKKEAASHRYNRLPLLPSGPGGFSRSWSCRRIQRYVKIQAMQKDVYKLDLVIRKQGLNVLS